MKFIDELLKNEKVEWKKLWEVTIWDKKFNGVEKHKQLKINKYYYYLASDLKKLISEQGQVKILTTNKTNIFANEENVKENMTYGEVVCIPWGGNPIIQYYKGKFITGDNRIATSYDTTKLNNKFLFYYLLNNKNVIASFYRGSGIKHPDMSKVLELEIPIPSLKTQEEIVKILDNFTKYVTELQAELQARNKQYNYYRDMLLSEDYLNRISNNLFIQSNNLIYKSKLSEITKLNRGKRLIRSQLHENGEYPVFQNSLTPLGYYNNKNFDGGKTCIVTAGAAGEIFYQDRDFWAADDVLVITADNILNKYLYYFLLNKRNLIKSKVRKASVPRLSRDDVEKIEVLLPPTEIQNKIVKILDRFQELLSDTKGLLPLEIEQRRKQYEYYREKLLTFDTEEGYALSTAQHSTAQHSTAQHSTAQHSTAQHSTAQHSTAQHSTAQHK